MDNPVLLRQQEIDDERRRRESYRFPVRIHYVYHNIERQDPNDNNVVLIRNFCKENSIYFLAREYNIDKYEEDCLYIRRLPAFQVYYDHAWDSTCYYPLSAISIAKNLIVEFETKERRVHDWGKRKRRFLDFFWDLFRKKSLMERTHGRRRSF
jgi:hypothetical protein